MPFTPQYKANANGIINKKIINIKNEIKEVVLMLVLGKVSPSGLPSVVVFIQSAKIFTVKSVVVPFIVISIDSPIISPNALLRADIIKLKLPSFIVPLIKPLVVNTVNVPVSLDKVPFS